MPAISGPLSVGPKPESGKLSLQGDGVFTSQQCAPHHLPDVVGPGKDGPCAAVLGDGDVLDDQMRVELGITRSRRQCG